MGLIWEFLSMFLCSNNKKDLVRIELKFKHKQTHTKYKEILLTCYTGQ